MSTTRTRRRSSSDIPETVQNIRKQKRGKIPNDKSQDLSNGKKINLNREFVTLRKKNVTKPKQAPANMSTNVKSSSTTISTNPTISQPLPLATQSNSSSSAVVPSEKNVTKRRKALSDLSTNVKASTSTTISSIPTIIQPLLLAKLSKNSTLSAIVPSDTITRNDIATVNEMSDNGLLYKVIKNEKRRRSSLGTICEDSNLIIPDLSELMRTVNFKRGCFSGSFDDFIEGNPSPNFGHLHKVVRVRGDYTNNNDDDENDMDI